MSHAFAIQSCRIVAPDKLPDRFLASGVLEQPQSLTTHEKVVLLYVLEITKPWFPSSKVLPSLLHTLEENYAALTPRNLGSQFELLLRTLNEQLNAISEQGETDWIGNLNGLVMVIGEDELHFSQTGHCPAYLLQKNRIRQITDEGSTDHDPHPLKTFSNLASGTIHEEDYLLISNHELYNEISLDALRRVMSSHSPYQACQSITKELKKEKNLAVSSIILKVSSRAEIENQKVLEPLAVILEDEMQSNLRKVQKKLAPIARKASEVTATVGKASWQIAKKTGKSAKNNLAPVVSSALKRGSTQVKNIQNKIGVKSLPTDVDPTPHPEELIEIIPPRSERERRVRQQTMVANQPDPTTPKTTTPLSRSLSLSLKKWFASPSRTRASALVVAILLIALGTRVALSRRHPAAEVAATNKDNALLSQAAELQKKAATDADLKQLVQASREVENAQKLLNNLTSSNEDSKKQADTIWDALLKTSDSLTSTTRFDASTAHYQLPAQASGLLSNPPFYYSNSPSVAGLLRTSQGSSNQTTIALPDKEDFIVSLAKSSENDTAAYALTHKNKVYRIIQDNDNTTLQSVLPTTGDFNPGNLIGSYNGNIYILDSKTGLLWKYVNTGTAYSKGVSVIDGKFDIKQSLSLAIDGSIYILKEDGNVHQFSSGQENTSFSLKNQPFLVEHLVQPLQVITDDTMQSLYVLDAGISSGLHSSARVLEFDKKGNYLRSFAFPKEFTRISSFSIDPKAKKLWVVNNNVVSEFSI